MNLNDLAFDDFVDSCLIDQDPLCSYSEQNLDILIQKITYEESYIEIK